MPLKKCALCKKTAYQPSRGKAKQEYWVCSSCQTAVDAALETASAAETSTKPSGLCDKCRKRTANCRFDASIRSKMTACSDWEGKHTERNQRRWAKFEN